MRRLLWCLLAMSSAAHAANYTAAPGPQHVASVYYTWTDAIRHREVPVKVYYPREGAGPFPVIIFSHGLGGTRDGYAYLGQHWASYGFVVVHVQHLGSDDAVWRGKAAPLAAMRAAAADLRNALDRPKDISFVIDQLTKMNTSDTPLKGRLDLGHIGVGGHSFGGYTVLAVSGEQFITRLGQAFTLADRRVTAAIAMSAPAPKEGTDLDRAFAKITIPVLHMTGTEDNSPIGLTTAIDRRLAFDHSSHADRYLVTFTGADHMLFSGRLRPASRDSQQQALILQCTTAFWDATLRADSAAMACLTHDFHVLLGKDGVWEMKTAK